MALWRVTPKGPEEVPRVRLPQEKVLEEKIEDWIAAQPELLGEPLYIIGRQVLIPDFKDRIDLMAADPQGNIVIIELKRGKLKDPVDIQALRYASYIAKWEFEQFEDIARNNYGKVSEPNFNFNDEFEKFCADAGVDEIPDLNQDQRIIIVGTGVKEKLGSVALWLREHSIDIRVIELDAYKEGESLLLEPRLIVPLEVSRFVERGGGGPEGVPPGTPPWVKDGRTWHLEKRCSLTTKLLFEVLDKILQENFQVDGPRWGQKDYVAYRVDNFMWLYINTGPRALRLNFNVRAKAFDADEVAKQLGIVKFEREETLSDKLSLPSSVWAGSRNEETDRVIIRVKEGFNLEGGAFREFLAAAYKACPRDEE